MVLLLYITIPGVESEKRWSRPNWLMFKLGVSG